MKLLIAPILCLCSFSVVSAPKSCSDYVDYLRVFYINGMFPPISALSDRIAPVFSSINHLVYSMPVVD
jgi:hypothetical protein